MTTVSLPPALSTPRCPACAVADLRALFPGCTAPRESLTAPELAADALRPLLAGHDREHCVLISLDSKHRLVAVDTVSIGTVDHTFMSPREIYRDALLRGASAILLGHNHPSGDPTPSDDDLRVTRRLARAGETIGVTLLDHVVIGAGGRYVSLAREGHL